MNKVTQYSPQWNGRNLSHDKELVSAYSVIGCKKGQMTDVITVRSWMGRSNAASVVYSTIWVHGDNGCAGHGSAGGGGYHKESAAIDEAITRAGIKLETAIGGCGDSAIRDALTAIARKMGYRKILIVTHG